MTKDTPFYTPTNWSTHFCGAAPKVELFDDISVLIDRVQRDLTNDPSRASEIQEFIQNISTDIGFDIALGAARSCYAGELVKPIEVRDNLERAKKIAKDTYKARHHTPYMHKNYIFGLDGVSRQFIWSHLHAHPFYNSEQVSQRYKKMTVENVVVPRLTKEQRKVFIGRVDQQFQEYDLLREDLLFDVACEEFYSRFPGKKSKHESNIITIRKKTQEAARYLIGLNTQAHLYHSINAVTLARYHRLSQQYDTPTEASIIINKMISEVSKRDPSIIELFDAPLPKEALLENKLGAKLFTKGKDPALTKQWAQEFDARLDGKPSLLTAHKENGIEEMLNSVRDIYGMPKDALDDQTILQYLFDPSLNTHRGDVLTLDHMQKISRSKNAPHFTFMMKLSATADAQEQRQRMSPASRPIFEQIVLDTPDYIVPSIVKASGDIAMEFFEESMHKTWEARNHLLELGAEPEMANYLLPNGIALRFRENVDLLNFGQKDEKRECLNAQEEISRLMLAQRIDVERVHPELKGVFGPPCYLRRQADIKPPCPEGDLYCGVPVFKALDTDATGESKNPLLSIEHVTKNRKY